MGICGLNTAYVLFATLHVVQFILSIVVIGLYGTDLDHARKAGTYADGKWVCGLPILSSLRRDLIIHELTVLRGL